MRYLYLLFTLVLVSSKLQAQENTYRPNIFFREDWKEIPAAIPLNQEHVANPDLIVNLYGDGRDSIKKSNHIEPIDDPFYVWSGLCNGNWMVTLKHCRGNVNLTGFAKIRWRTKQSGLRQLRISLKLSDGTWLISDLFDGASKDWKIKEFNIQDITWHLLDIERITELGVVDKPDLFDVEEIGFTDLMPGGKSNACSRLDWIEVWGSPSER